MNNVEFIGRLSKDIELNTTPNRVSVAKTNIAVDRKFKKEDGTHDTDFFNLVFWRGLADTVSKYCKKGQRIYVRGELQNRSWDKEDGTKGFVTEVIVNDVEFLDNKPTTEQTNTPIGTLEPIADDDSLPF